MFNILTFEVHNKPCLIVVFQQLSKNSRDIAYSLKIFKKNLKGITLKENKFDYYWEKLQVNIIIKLHYTQ